MISRVSRKDKKKKGFGNPRYLFPEELKKNERYGWLLVICSVLLLISIFVVSNLTYSRSAQKYTKAQAYETMTEVSRQISKVISTRIQYCFESLDLAQTMLYGFLDPENREVSVSEVTAALEGLSLASFDKSAVVLADGSVFCSDNQSYDLSDEPFIQTLLQSGGNLAGKVENENFADGILFARSLDETLKADGNEIAGIIGIVPVSELITLMESDIFGENMSYVVISDKSGNVILQTSAKKTFGDNLLDTFATFADEETQEQLKSDLESGADGTLDIMGTTREFMTYYTPVLAEEDDSPDTLYSAGSWRLLVLSRTDVLTQHISSLFNASRKLLYFILVLFSLLLCGLIFLFVYYRNTKLRLTCVDHMTGLLHDERFKQDANLLIRRGGNYALVSYNILRFKAINSQIGHEKGDGILEAAGAEIKKFLASDETAAHSFADRFTVLLRMDTGADRIRALEQCLMSAVYPEQTKVKFTIGVYMLTEEDKDISVAMDRARLAQSMTRGKHNVLSNMVIYDQKMDDRQKDELFLTDMAEEALEKGHFLVYYQLKRNILNDTWGGCEALVRWKDPECGFIHPDRFIPVFERNGFIVKLDKYVFETVCRDLCECISRGIKTVPVSINLSRCHFEEDGFPADYEEILSRYDLPHELIEFEVTETLASDSAEKIIEMIEWAHGLGCRCSLDDFGTGYSSLNMLQDLKFDVIKLDRSFFYGAEGFNQDSRRIVKTLVSLSHELGKTVVSEGIEDRERADFLKDHQCDMIQGYYYARPLPAEDCIDVLQAPAGQEERM